MKRTSVLLIVLSLSLALLGAQPKIITTHALALQGMPKYKAGFTHFDYVNPDAPKGGTFRVHTIGTYDNFNRYAQRGDPAVASEGFYDSLMTQSEDEVDVWYGLIAEKVEYQDDFKWIVFHINPAARFQDGKAITADDVVFSFNKFMKEGVPQFRLSYETVEKVEALDARRVRFTFSEGDKALMFSLGGLTILPSQFWQTRNFAEPLTVVPPGSGAYTVKDFKMGEYIVYERLKNYWARNIPVIKGQLNFDFIRYDYYRDETVAFEAFKAGEYDYYQENIAKNWATLYTGQVFSSNFIRKAELPHEIPLPMQAFVFNIQRPMFADRRVREAIGYALDFEWMNKNLFYDQYVRVRSYFANTQYEAKGLPGAGELRILEPIKAKVPPEVFTKEYRPPATDGSGNIRNQTRLALELFKAAGWEVRNQKMVNVQTGQPMEFELMIYSPSIERVAIPIKQNLERFGITMNIRIVDTSQYVNRAHERDFDLIDWGYSANFYPSADLRIVWRSDYIDSTYNRAGVQDEAVDYLIDGIVANQENQGALLDWGRALDRVLTWNHYVMPMWGHSKFRIAYWDRFSMPTIRPKYSIGTGTWWFDSAKNARLPK
jgi:microcin C transport system substrate-binding protein